jgi:hypothetical protein
VKLGASPEGDFCKDEVNPSRMYAIGDRPHAFFHFRNGAIARMRDASDARTQLDRKSCEETHDRIARVELSPRLLDVSNEFSRAQSEKKYLDPHHAARPATG